DAAVESERDRLVRVPRRGRRDRELRVASRDQSVGRGVTPIARATRVVLIAAVAKNGVIGIGGKLPWHLPDDLKRFKQLTLGNPILMGRKTHESIGKALPGRTNVVVTRREGFRADGCVVAHSFDGALDAVKDATEIAVI